MSALSREELTEACRALFSLAGENLILPPLIRDAGDALATSGYTYYCAAGQRCVRFDVEFDQAYVNQTMFPLQRLPLQISCLLCDQDYQIVDAKFDENEQLALIGSFFLGAQAPITVEVNEAGGDFKLSVQLSPTFFAEWREPLNAQEKASAESLCRRVGQCLYEKSREFFGSRETGIAIWSLRAGQELLGAPKLTTDALWPFISFGFVFGGHAPANEASQTEESSTAISVSVPAPAPASIPVVQRAQTPQLRTDPALVVTPQPASTLPPSTTRRWPSLGGLAAAAALLASLGALLQPAAMPHWATSSVPLSLPVASSSTSNDGALSLQPAPPPTQVAVVPEAPSPSTVPSPAFDQPTAGASSAAPANPNSSVSWPLADDAPKAARRNKPTAAKKPPSTSKNAKALAANDAAPKHGVASHVTRKARGGGPMQSVGREMDRMANSLIKGITSIPSKIVKIAE